MSEHGSVETLFNEFQALLETLRKSCYNTPVMDNSKRKEKALGKIIAVASGKGGTGKTTAVAALSSCLAALGKRTKTKVLCIDFDVGMRNLDFSLAMSDYVVMDFMDVANGVTPLMSAVSESPAVPNLFFLTAPSDLEDTPFITGVMSESEYNTYETKLKAMFKEIRENFDYCLIDSPPGIGAIFNLAHCDVDMSVIVTIGEQPAIRDAQQTATAIREMGIENVRLLVNRVKRRNYKQIRSTIDDVIDTVGVQLLGIIPEDKNVLRSLHAGTPLILNRSLYSAHHFLDAALRILGNDVKLRRI